MQDGSVEGYSHCILICTAAIYVRQYAPYCDSPPNAYEDEDEDDDDGGGEGGDDDDVDDDDNEDDDVYENDGEDDDVEDQCGCAVVIRIHLT